MRQKRDGPQTLVLQTRRICPGEHFPCAAVMIAAGGRPPPRPPQDSNAMLPHAEHRSEPEQFHARLGDPCAPMTMKAEHGFVIAGTDTN